MTVPIDVNNAARRPFMPVMRELVRAYQAFASYDARSLREMGLTVPQADVLFTLGNTPGMTCKEIGERTLITKGTLTGVLDRMERKGLCRRVRSSDDRRCVNIVLTEAGEALFVKSFPRHIANLETRFAGLSKQELADLQTGLRRLRELF